MLSVSVRLFCRCMCQHRRQTLCQAVLQAYVLVMLSASVRLFFQHECWSCSQPLLSCSVGVCNSHTVGLCEAVQSVHVLVILSASVWLFCQRMCQSGCLHMCYSVGLCGIHAIRLFCPCMCWFWCLPPVWLPSQRMFQSVGICRGHAVSFRYGCPVSYVLSASASAVLSASVPFIMSVSSRSVLCPFFPFRCTWQPPIPPSLGSRFTTFPLHIRLRYNGFTFASAVFPRDC